MTKKPLQKLWLFLISGLTVTTITVLACADGDWSGHDESMFAPEIINQPKYTPFFRTIATPFYDGYDDASPKLLQDENCKDWTLYVGNNISKEAINYWLYEASINQIDSMIFEIKKKPSHLTAKSMQYSLKSIQPESKANAFLYYLGFAKRNESIVNNGAEYWRTPQKNTEVVSVTKQITGAINFLAKSTDPFMKERYAFQLERLYFFNKEYDKTIKTYIENETSFKTETNLKWRALSYEAGAFYRRKEYAKANYLFSKIYDGFEPLKKSAYLSFHPQNQADWVGCLALAKTTHEKEVLWQLFGLYADYVTAMREILKLNPKSELVDLLLVRSINIEEEKFSGILKSDVKEKNEMINKIDKNLVTFLNEMAQNTTSNNPAVWLLSAAYLNYIQNDFVTADKQLKMAEKYSKNSNLINEQYHLISAIGKITRLTELNSKAENDLMPDLKLLFRKTKSDDAFRVEYANQWIRNTLARLAEKKGEFEKAQLVGGVDNTRFESIDNIKAMITYYDKANKTEFEKLFFDVASLTSFDYSELLAVRYTQQDRLEDALRTFKSIPKYNGELPGNPFTIRIRDCHDCDHEAKQKVKYTSASFIEKLIEMKNTALSKPAEAAQNYFLIANGFYNMTYFGNARNFYISKVNSSEYYYAPEGNYPEMNCDLALKYYLMAKEKSTDKEFQAKCIFMGAKCEQNKFFINKPKDYSGDFRSGIYFAMLSKDYSTTKYHAEILKECSYYRQYTGK